MRHWFSVIAIAFGTSGFWGFFLALVANQLFGISKDKSLLFIAVPVSLAFFIYAVRRLHRTLH